MDVAAVDRDAALAWALYAGVALLLLALSVGLVLYWQPPRAAAASASSAPAGAFGADAPARAQSRLVTGVSAAALFLALLALLTAPVDVFLLEHALPHVHASEAALRALYTAYFAALALYAFAGAPLVYNYARQTELAPLTLRFSARARLAAAAKRTGCFLLALLFALLVALVLLLCGKPASSDVDWLKPLLHWSSDLEAFLRLVTGLLALLGSYVWLAVGARGLATVPVVGLLVEDGEAAERAAERAVEQLLAEAALEQQDAVRTRATILTRYAGAQAPSAADRERLARLADRERLLLERRSALAAGLQRGARGSWWRPPVGAALLLVSLLLVASLLLTTLDKAVHSGFRRGFLLNEPAWPNPVDALLVLASRFFPLDYVLFAAASAYQFAAAVAVLSRHGVALLCARVARLRPRATPAPALVAASLALAFVAFVALFSALTLAPQYATFGHQRFVDAQTQRVRRCTLEEAARSLDEGADRCRMSQLARVYNSLAAALPMFGAAFFLAQLAFCVLFASWLAHGCCVARRQPEDARDPKREPLLVGYV